jgi:two-component system NtrC family response regulator
LAPKGFSPEFFRDLSSYDWPGNVRELVNVLDTAMAAAHREPTLFPPHLPPYLRAKLARDSVLLKPDKDNGGNGKGFQGNQLSRLNEVRKTALALVEKRYLQDLMRQEKGNIQAACRVSGLSRPRLYSLLKQYGICPSLAAKQAADHF